MVGSGAPPEAEVAGDDGPDSPLASDSRVRRPGPRRPSPLVVILAITAVLGLVGTGVFWSKWHSLSSRDHQQGAVTTTSTEFLKALTNFDAATIDADFNRVESYAVGHFKGQADQFFSSDVRKALAKVQAVSRGQIRDLYVESLKGDQATVYASVDQTIANINFKAPEQDQLRIVLNLARQPQGWRISDVTVLQAPAVPTPGGATPGGTPIPPGAIPPTTTP
ncbi:MAG: hypothetical protein NVS3B21_14220 [Acidimicrobiales bacterium]